MPARSERFGLVKFSELGVRLTDCQELQMKQNHIKELKLLCPSINTFRDSELVTKLVSLTNGVYLEYWLSETVQRNLPIPASGKARQLQAAADPYANELSLAREQVANAPEVIELAMGPAITIDELRLPDTKGKRTRRTRDMLRQKELLQIPVVDLPTMGRGFDTPKYLALANVVNLSAVPVAIYKKAVDLCEFQLLLPVPQALENIELPKKILMTRPSAAVNPEVASKFAQRLDTGQRVSFKASVVYSWVNGRPAELTFLEFI